MFNFGLAVIPITMAVIAVFVALVIVLYYMVYRIKINKSITEERPLKRPMAEPKSVANVLLTVLIIVVGFGIVMLMLMFMPSREKISSMENDMYILQQRVDSLEQYNRTYITDDEEEDDTVESSEATVVDYDVKTRKATVKFSVRLKRTTQNTTVSIAIGEEEFELKKVKTTVYEGTHKLDIFTDYDEDNNYIVVSDGKTTTTHSADELELDGLYSECLPKVKNVRVIYGDDNKPSRWNYHLDVSFIVWNTVANKVKFNKDTLKLAVYKNDELIKEENVPAGIKDDVWQIGIKSDIPFRENDSIYVYLLVEDTAGFTHKVCLLDLEDLYGDGDARFENEFSENDIILDKNGKVLTEFEDDE